MILKVVEPLEAFGYDSLYKYFSLAGYYGYDKWVESVLEKLDSLPVCLEWISTKDKLPDEEGWYLCVVEGGILPLKFIEESDRFFWVQCDVYISESLYWMPDEIDYWADYKTLPIPKE